LDLIGGLEHGFYDFPKTESHEKYGKLKYENHEKYGTSEKYIGNNKPN